ncbi:hypothetical protein [Streptomyces sp. CWNU-52B]|uniref:hypothetical protein n=1 Tax=unclassified Streptomyces TaxID=2593676 RepID=UPI0039C19AF0
MPITRTAHTGRGHNRDTTTGLQRDADALRDAGVTGVSVRLETPDGVRSVPSTRSSTWACARPPSPCCSRM